MKTRVAAVLLALSALVSCAFAQKNDSKRMEAIWDTVYNRMVDQNNIWFESGDYPRCVGMLHYQHTLWPSDYETATDLGWMLENIDRYDEALAIYVNYRKNYPTQSGAAFPEANFYYQKKLYTKVPPILEPSIANKSMSSNGFRLLAHAYERLNMLKDAERTWSLYISLAPSDGAAKRNLERVQKKLAAAKA